MLIHSAFHTKLTALYSGAEIQLLIERTMHFVRTVRSSDSGYAEQVSVKKGMQEPH